MPASEHAFSDLLPPRLYLDTDVVIAALVTTERHHERSRAFVERLARREQTVVVVSSLLWIEYANAAMRERFRQTLPSSDQRRFRLHRWQEASVRRLYLQSFVRALDGLLELFEWEEVALTTDVRNAALAYIASHNFRPHDAVHLASAVQAGVTDLASLDESFRRVDGLQLWNDLIYGGTLV